MAEKKGKEQLESDIDIKDIVVIDNGTETTKMGFSGEDYPRFIIDSVSAYHNVKNESEGLTNHSSQYFGANLKELIQEKKHELQYCYPVVRGQVEEWEVMKELWEFVIDDGMQVSEVSACNFLMIDSPINTKENKQKMAEIIFDDMKSQSVLFMNSASLSLFSIGETTGLVVESGHGLTTVTPIFEGYPIYHAIQHRKIAGVDVTQRLFEDLKTIAPEYFSTERSHIETFAIIKDIKEKLCGVALDFNSVIKGPNTLTEDQRSYELPDGNIIEIDHQIKYTNPEILFNPKIIEPNDTGMSLPEMIKDSISRCDEDLQNELIKCIVICGGNTVTNGFVPRLQKEIIKIVGSRHDLEIKADSLRHYAAWIGGSMLGSLSTFQNLAITRGEYDENPEGKLSIVQKRTF